MEPGLKNAVRLAGKVAKTVPAYKRFLEKHGYPLSVKSSEDFFKLPVLDKKNYIISSKTEKLWDPQLFPAMAYASSGSSGEPTFWFRSDKEEKQGSILHKNIFQKIFGISPNDPTLVIVCFSMGIWVAGGFTLAACRQLSREGFKLTTVTPGIEKGDIFSILKKLAPLYKHVILAGYPSFIMDIAKESVHLLPKNLKVLTAGDKFSEKFRDKLLELSGQRNSLHSVVSLYGSADAGPMAFETPLSIFLRREAEENRAFREKLFGQVQKLPALLQYNPENVFFENVGKELVLTADLNVPLIRYNIHDLGRSISYDNIVALLKNEGLLNKATKKVLKAWRLPFVLQEGRTDVALTFYALNLLPEHFDYSLTSPLLKKYFSGSYFATSRTIRNHTKEILEISIELKSSERPKKALAQKITENICKSLESVNMEYRKLHQTLGKIAEPKVLWVENGSLYKHSHRTDSGLLSITGKKPKLIKL